MDAQVTQMKNDFIQEIIACGFDKADVEYLVEKRGVHSMDKFVIIEELNTIKFDRGKKDDERKEREKKTRPKQETKILMDKKKLLFEKV